MTEKNVEVGPIVATAMIAIGIATVVWAVSTNPHRSAKPLLKVDNFEVGQTSTAATEDPGISDAEWEQALIEFEAIKTDGLLTSINAALHTATVDADKWSALSDDRRREIGRHLAAYCGRVGGSEEYKVEIVDKNGIKLGSYQRN
jgi:hypothetical protein